MCLDIQKALRKEYIGGIEYYSGAQKGLGKRQRKRSNVVLVFKRHCGEEEVQRRC